MDTAAASAVERLIRPRSIAIVGASSDPTRTAGRPLRSLLTHGFAGTILPVNPRAESIEGIRCYPSVAALPTTPDVGLVLVGADHVADAIRQLAALGTPAAIVLAGGYAEVGADGARRQAELKAAAGPMRLLGPNTIGLVNVTDDTVISPSSALEIAPLTPGRIGLVSQSGGILGSVLSRAEARGIGFSRLVGTGNEADLQVNDIVAYLLDDDATAVIALYLEGLRDVAGFRHLAARAAALGKPLVAFKVGRSEAGARSASSHTGALAGADRVYDALFEQYGVIRAATFADLLDVSGALATGRRLGGRRLGVLTSTGGAGVLVADAAGVAGFAAPDPDPATAGALADLLPGDKELAARNPVDLTLAGLRADVFRSAIAALQASPSYDALVVIVGSSGLAQPELAAGPIVEAVANSLKPLLAYVSPGAPNIMQYLNRRGVPAFDQPEGVASALSALARVAQVGPAPAAAVDGPGSGPAGAGREGRPGADAAGPSHPLGSIAALSGHLNEFESKRLFARFGIPGVRERVAASPAAAVEAARTVVGRSGRVVLKVLSRDLAHKTEAGGVVVGVALEDVAAEATALLLDVRERAPRARIEGVLVQEQVTDAAEVILGLTRDPQVGPVILVGAGGVGAEIYQDVVMRLPPIGRADAAAMVARLRCYPLLTGYRGRAPADLDALVDAIVAFGGMARELGDRLVEAEINPLFVLPAGGGVVAADGLAVLA